MQRKPTNKLTRKIDFVFYHADEIRKHVEAGKRSAILKGGKKLDRLDEWLAVIDETNKWADPLKRGLIRKRYRGEDYRRTCLDLSISQATYSTMLKEIRSVALSFASFRRLVKIK